jgi:hypothetical protein
MKDSKWVWESLFTTYHAGRTREALRATRNEPLYSDESHGLLITFKHRHADLDTP